MNMLITLGLGPRGGGGVKCGDFPGDLPTGCRNLQRIIIDIIYGIITIQLTRAKQPAQKSVSVQLQNLVYNEIDRDYTTIEFTIR